MIYTAELTSDFLKLSESRLIADQMLMLPGRLATGHLSKNILQAKSKTTAANLTHSSEVETENDDATDNGFGRDQGVVAGTARQPSAWG